ncbi:MAG: NYN domain-containing protein [Yoonia sp.]|uniref:NYN domain-containing protein n=1 Tax=Yoonia sp. TaxID=2212373 RepID=UPI00273DE682|nr:NYN domain-containing protein [Yoonia sp.]MDP5084463.1 NYN domain-containing protein [Yoonia sp.]
MPKDRMLLAVLIDADNIPARYASEILREITTYGEPALRRVYGDWSSPALANWKREVVELGMVANQETANTKGKNASDIGLVIDAMDILHTGRFDGFVLVSSDSDFTALANRLREDGVEVIGIGEAKAPVSLRNVCNRFILIENIVGSDKDQTKAEAPKTEKVAQSASNRQPPSKAVPLIIKAMESIDSEGDWFSLGPLGQHITRAHPDFDPRTYGSPKLSDLLAKTGRFEVKKEGKTVEVRRLD